MLFTQNLMTKPPEQLHYFVHDTWESLRRNEGVSNYEVATRPPESQLLQINFRVTCEHSLQ